MMTRAHVTKEFHKLTKSIGRLSNNQAVISCWDDEDVSRFTLKISPNGGPYNGGSFYFTVKLPEAFPSDPPQVRCETHIYHPNIDPTEESDDTNVCINMFEEWQESYGVDGIVQGLLFLFYEPNLEDPLSPYFDSSTSCDDFEENVLASLKGETVEQVSYTWNYFGKPPSSQEEEDVTVDTNDNDNGKEGDDDKGDNQSDTTMVEGHKIHNVQPLDSSVNVVVRKVEGSLDTVEDIPMHDRGDFQEEHNKCPTMGVRQPWRRSMYLRLTWMLLKSALDPFSHR